MMLRRTLEGASKCALRDLRREEWRAASNNIVSIQLCRKYSSRLIADEEHTLGNLGHCDG